MTPPLLDELIALRGLARRDLRFPSRFAPTAGPGDQRVIGRATTRGLEFVESRPYQRGDDVRAIDWRVTARQGRPHTKVFAAEREQPLWLVVDSSASMRFGSVVQLKSTLAARAAAWLAWTGRAGRNSIGAVVASSAGPRMLPPKTGDHGVLTLFAALCQMAGESFAEVGDGLSHALSALRPRLRFGDRIAVISDFYGLDDPACTTLLEAALVALGERGEVVLLQVFDPLEANPPQAGRYPVWSGGEVVWLDLADPAITNIWRSTFEQRGEALTRLASKYRWPCLSLSTAGDLAADLASMGAGR